MKVLILFVGWCILFVLCWPLALLALILFPVVWLVSLVFRLVGMTADAIFTLLRTILFLPARLLGERSSRCHAFYLADLVAMSSLGIFGAYGAMLLSQLPVAIASLIGIGLVMTRWKTRSRGLIWALA